MQNKDHSKKELEDAEALLYHKCPWPGKFTIKPTKPMNN